MTADEVADELRVGRATVYRMAIAKKIPARKVGRQWRFSRARLKEWLAGGAEAAIGPDRGAPPPAGEPAEGG